MTQQENASPIRIVKQNTCPSLSGASELTYEIGSDSSGAISLRLTSNSGNGKFNTNWVAISTIEELIANRPGSNTLCASALRPLYKGKSTNSPSFLLAVLLSESIVGNGPDRDSGYQLGDIPAFKKAVADLMAKLSDAPVGKGMPNSTTKPKRSGKEGA